jgi:hypothetical protein
MSHSTKLLLLLALLLTLDACQNPSRLQAAQPGLPDLAPASWRNVSCWHFTHIAYSAACPHPAAADVRPLDGNSGPDPFPELGQAPGVATQDPHCCYAMDTEN